MSADFDWEAEGVRLGETLDGHHAIVVLGTDETVTARVAIGIGRAQAHRRHVAVGDLLGEAAPIQSLVEGDDPHGITDSFVYGVSLNRIAREVPSVPGLFIMPTGTEPVDAAAVFPSPRWRRLASGFREMGALLVLAARADAPAVAELTTQLDGAVLVGEVVPSHVPVASVISVVRRPVELIDDELPLSPAPGIEVIEPPAERRVSAVRIAQGAAAALLIAALGVWFAMRPFASQTRPYAPKPDTTRTAAAVIAGAAGTQAPATPSDSVRAALLVANPQDSANAAAFAVELLSANTQAGAAARVREESNRTPASTFTPAVVDGAEWYKVVAGAYLTREPADSLGDVLRRRGLRGTVVRLPYAYLVNSAVASDKVQGLLNAYRDLGQPVYALEQGDGTFNVYAGAFETPAQAALLMESLRAAGIAPTLVFRTGRVL
jgi:hypothetical protein